MKMVKLTIYVYIYIYTIDIYIYIEKYNIYSIYIIYYIHISFSMGNNMDIISILSI